MVLLFKEWKSHNRLKGFVTGEKAIAEGLLWTSLLSLVMKRRGAQLTDPLIFGSSRFSGEGSLDFQEEVVRVPEAIGHSLDHLDAVVHPFQ